MSNILYFSFQINIDIKRVLFIQTTRSGELYINPHYQLQITFKQKVQIRYIINAM